MKQWYFFKFVPNILKRLFYRICFCRYGSSRSQKKKTSLNSTADGNRTTDPVCSSTTTGMPFRCYRHAAGRVGRMKTDENKISIKFARWNSDRVRRLCRPVQRGFTVVLDGWFFLLYIFFPRSPVGDHCARARHIGPAYLRSRTPPPLVVNLL